MTRGVAMRVRASFVVLFSVAAALVFPVTLGSPAGAATSRDPVIIVAGTFASEGPASVYYAPLAARLRADGYQAYIFGLPGGGLGDIADTSQALNVFADQVRAQTGASRVDMIGHSQGGLVGRYYIKFLGGASEVDSMISLGAPHYGTSLANLATLLGLGSCLGVVACQQMAIGSSFLANLNAGDDTIGNVDYTNIASANDEIVTPFTTAFLNNDGNNHNVLVQSPCFLRVVGHIGLPLDGTVYSGVQDAVAHRTISLNCFAL
jgi:triacylglycerol esterase/lipase EstA (alpha/beta hydrolase family)